MKKKFITPVLAFVALSILVVSCKKDEDTTPTPGTGTGTGTSSGATAPTPDVGSVDGLLLSLRLDLATETAGFVVNVATENALATFFTSTGSSSSFEDGGVVKVNTFELEKQTNNSYIKTATTGMTPSDLNFDSDKSEWDVAGAGSVPAFTYNHNSTFPSFTDTLPTTVNRSADFTIDFTGKASGADSIIIMIAKDDKSIVKTFAGTAASGTITASEMSILPAVTDKTAILEVVPYNFTTSVQGGKTYAFIKQYALVTYVNLN